VTKQSTAKWLKSRMLFSEWYKIMVNKFTSVGFRGSDRPPDSASVSCS